MRRLIIVFVVLLNCEHACKSSAGEVQSTAIKWTTLAPAGSNQFSDPFSTLSSNQLQDLGYVVQVQDLIATEKLSPESEDAIESAKIARQLKQSGVDIPWLMAQRKQVRKLREQQARAISKVVVKKLEGKRVILIGYILPLKITDGRIMEFCMVPSISNCSHADLPPSNQLVLVKSQKGITIKDRLTAVRVTGGIEAKPTTRTIQRIDGPKKFTAAYVIVPEKTEVINFMQ